MRNVTWLVVGVVAILALVFFVPLVWNAGSNTASQLVPPKQVVVQQQGNAPAPQQPAGSQSQSQFAPPQGQPQQENVQQTFTAAQVDKVLGNGNWYCFSDRLDGVAVVNWPLNGFVYWPLSAVDKGIKYGPNQQVKGTGAATAWLAGVLPENECPPMPEADAIDIVPNQSGGSQTVAGMLNSYAGLGNWSCFSDRSNAVKILSYPDKVVDTPIGGVNQEGHNGTLGVGQKPTVGKPATAWLTEGLNIDPSLCPSYAQ